jgi:hypothetical protein
VQPGDEEGLTTIPNPERVELERLQSVAYPNLVTSVIKYPEFRK